MKIYTFQFELERVAEKRFWCPPHSDFRIGVRVLKAGVDQRFTVEKDGETLTPDAETYAGYTTFTLKSEATGSAEYAVKSGDQVLQLTQVTTDSTVFEIGSAGAEPGPEPEPVDPGKTVVVYRDGTSAELDIEGTLTESSVPDKLNAAKIEIGDKVTGIGSSALEACADLTAVTIPDSVKTIGQTAFASCTSLAELTIPSSVSSIGQNAFFHSGLTSVTFEGKSQYFVERMANYSWGLTDTSVIHGDTDVSNLTRVTYSDESVQELNIVGDLRDDSIPNKNDAVKLVIGDSVTSIGEWAFMDCSGLTSVTIPDSVTSIGDSAFYECSGLTSVTIPDSVTSIGDEAFRNCIGLTSVTIGNSVTSIGESAFDGCEGLTSVTIPDSVTSIGDSAFHSCTSLTSVVIPDSVTSIGNYAFYDCSGLTSVTIGNGVTSIGERAFYSCSGLTGVTIGNGVTSIGESAFAYCSRLTSMTIPDSVTSIGT